VVKYDEKETDCSGDKRGAKVNGKRVYSLGYSIADGIKSVLVSTEPSWEQNLNTFPEGKTYQ
jgi:hypothetical protein